MISRRIVPLIGASVLAAAALGVGQASAHHAFSAEFDANAPVLLRGPVVKVEWINPHAWVHIKNTNPQYRLGEWMVEGGTPNTLLRAGINRNTLKPGAEIIVRGYQSIDKSCTPMCRANGRDVTFPDGRKVFMGSSGTGAPHDGADPSER